jgi:hypothetical protein
MDKIVIDSTAFRRGVRAFKTGRTNPYNGPELRDEWQAGRDYAARRVQPTASREMRAAMAAVDATYDRDYMADGRAVIARATGAAS